MVEGYAPRLRDSIGHDVFAQGQAGPCTQTPAQTTLRVLCGPSLMLMSPISSLDLLAVALSFTLILS